MRLWSLHPRYLDASGLVACWREGLLARAVLSGNTIGYRSHPQLIRFKACPDPLGAVDAYLMELLAESVRRGYRFDASKIGAVDPDLRLTVTDGQLAYEWRHLQDKLRLRAPHLCSNTTTLPEAHPLFAVRPGEIENWEIDR